MTHGRPRATRRSLPTAGVAAVEFALVLPLLLTLVMGAIDWGWYFFVDQVVTNAAREGARAGSVIPTTNQGLAYTEAQNAALDYLDRAKLKKVGVTVTVPFTVGGVNSVKVQISYPVGSLTRFFPAGIFPTNANASAVMRWQ